jgi:hypothetical protein
MWLFIYLFLFRSLHSSVFNSQVAMFSRRAGFCSGYALGLWSGGARFESRPGWRLSLLIFFVVFLVPSHKCWDNSSIKQRPPPYKCFPVHPPPAVRCCAGNLRYVQSRTITPRRKLAFPHTFSLSFLLVAYFYILFYSCGLSFVMSCISVSLFPFVLSCFIYFPTTTLSLSLIISSFLTLLCHWPIILSTWEHQRRKWEHTITIGIE